MNARQCSMSTAGFIYPPKSSFRTTGHVFRFPVRVVQIIIPHNAVSEQVLEWLTTWATNPKLYTPVTAADDTNSRRTGRLPRPLPKVPVEETFYKDRHPDNVTSVIERKAIIRTDGDNSPVLLFMHLENSFESPLLSFGIWIWCKIFIGHSERSNCGWHPM